ncbi:MAG: hypothetical protein EXS05_17985 [Planctomycetaceae bacterium]|nr:hypothetical protein [Planctomycetaceae bacterium]
MSTPDRSHALIQRYLDGVSSEAELAELEQLLATDLQFASAFAEASRLHAGLEGYFRKQYKIDQVAALLAASQPVSSAADRPAGGRSDGPPVPERLVKPASPPVPTFVPGYRWWSNSRGVRIESRPANAFQRLSRYRWQWIAAAMLLLTLGTFLWSSRNQAQDRPFQIISGRVAVAGREVTEIHENALFEVVGQGAAVIELAGGTRVELFPSTRATFRRDSMRLLMHLESGGGDFSVQPDQPAVQVETVLGMVRSEGSRFSLDLVTVLPKRFSPTAPVWLPTLSVVVAQGSVTVEHAGVATRLAAGEQRVFMNPT